MAGWLPACSVPSPQPVGRPLLALSEICGDLRALDAVLAAVDTLELCGIVVAGDHCLGGEQPFEVMQRLRELNAVLVRGPTDLALGTLRADEMLPESGEQARALRAFIDSQSALGEVLCRRLAELPTSAVVSLDDHSGVMVVAGSPRDDYGVLGPEFSDGELEEATFCVAEDVLVCGRSAVGFVRRLSRHVFVNAGSVGKSALRTPDGGKTAHAVLIQPFSDGVIRAFPADIDVPKPRRPRAHRKVS